jgi:hypothetical protein
MADLEAICNEIKTALRDNLSEFHVYTAEVEQITTPAIQIDPNEIDYSDSASMGRGLEKWDITIRVLLTTVTERSSKVAMWQFFGQANDIKNVIESHVPLQDGSVGHAVYVRRAGSFGIWDYNGNSYRGGEFNVDVYA